jgi:hypothetical protein
MVISVLGVLILFLHVMYTEGVNQHIKCVSLFGSNNFRMHLCMRKVNRRIILLLDFAS